jgi:hypothetical protein
MGRGRGPVVEAAVADARADSGFQALFGARRGSGKDSANPAPDTGFDSGLDSEPDLGFVENRLSPALEAAWEAGDQLCHQNYNTPRTIGMMNSHPLRHIYVDARYTQDGELVAVSSYEECIIDAEYKCPYRVLYRGKDVGALAAKLAAVGKQLEGEADDPFSLTVEKVRVAGDPAAGALTRKILRIARDRKRAAKLLA